MAKTRGTQAEIPPALEFGKDTVYERKNVVRVEATEDDQFEGWEYDETQYTYPEYVRKQNQDNIDVKLALAELAEIITGG